MVCSISCTLAFAFIIASIYTCMFSDKRELHKKYIALLDNTKKVRYRKIVQERKSIYFKGFALGLALAIGFLIYKKTKLVRPHKWGTICTVLAIAFVTNYFFYILHPKSDHMIMHINSQEEKLAWLKIYRSMQYNYHFGFALGLIGIMFLGNSIC